MPIYLPPPAPDADVVFDAADIRQSPTSPVPRQGPQLSPLVPLDANYNPQGTHVDPRRVALNVRYVAPMASGTWFVLASTALRNLMRR